MHYGDLVGQFDVFSQANASAASNASDGTFAGCQFRVDIPTGKAGYFLAAYWTPDSSQAGSATNYTDLFVYKNLNSTASASVASYTLSATTASVAASTPGTFTNVTATATLALADGDVLSFYHASAGNGIAIVAGNVQIKWRIR